MVAWICQAGNEAMSTEHRVTIVVVPREQFSKTQASLESIYAGTPAPFDLIYVDGNSPPPVERYLLEQSQARGFRLLRVEHYLTSNEARNMALQQVRSEYVAFLDNDVFVSPGWLEALVGCAEETGAWVVGPLYCYGRDGSDGQPRTVHTAGAHLVANQECGFLENHRYVDWPVEEVRSRLRREPIDLVEFHCMLVRMTVFERMGPLDEKLLSFLDHVDFCLAVREAGQPVFFEPQALVTHLVPPPFSATDRSYFLLRWSDAWLQPSIRHFAAKYRLTAGDPGFLAHVVWRNDHRRRLIAPLRRGVERWLGRVGRRIADEIADRIVFNGLIEQTVVRRMQARRHSNGAPSASRTP